MCYLFKKIIQCGLFSFYSSVRLVLLLTFFFKSFSMQNMLLHAIILEEYSKMLKKDYIWTDTTFFLSLFPSIGIN